MQSVVGDILLVLVGMFAAGLSIGVILTLVVGKKLKDLFKRKSRSK